jgi:NitT/TauT family transport system ATP-binding protein
VVNELSRTPNMPPAIHVSGLRKTFKESGGTTVTVFEDLNLKVEAGKVTCIVGPSGCGKTTLLNIIAGLALSDAGTVKISGRTVRSSNSNGLGYMFQRDSLFPWRTALQNATLGYEVASVRRDGTQFARKLLAEFGLRGFENAYPDELSEGMRRRVALARTLVVEPDLLLLDEPFAGVDYEVQLALENDLLARARKGNVTTLCVTHDLEAAIVLADYIVTMTPRPARVRTVYEISLPMQPREALAVRQTSEFRRYLSMLAKDVLGIQT